MKKSFFYFIFLWFVSLHSFAQTSNKPYTDKFILATDLMDAVQKRNIPKINSIAKTLTLPYNAYLTDIFPTYKKDTTTHSVTFPINEIHPASWFIRDSLMYNSYAADFYFGRLIESMLNDFDDTVFGKNIYVVSDKSDNIVNEKIKSNYLGILFETRNYVKIINLEALSTINNQLYSLRQGNYKTYSKEELPSYLTNKKPDNFIVYKLNKNNFTAYSKDTILFDNVNYKAQAVTLDTKQDITYTKEFIGKTSINSTPKDTTVLDWSEEMPSFQGGDKALRKYLKENLRYPKAAVKGKLEGKVIVKFVVDKDGNIKDPVVIKDDIGAGCADEAIRLVTKMPKWWSGKQNGKRVSVYYTLPITFSLKN